jgi:hypothetical protein
MYIGKDTSLHFKNFSLRSKVWEALDLFKYTQCKKLAGICRNTTPELLSVPEFLTGTYQYVLGLYQFIFFHFSDGISLFLL